MRPTGALAALLLLTLLAVTPAPAPGQGGCGHYGYAPSYSHGYSYAPSYRYYPAGCYGGSYYPAGWYVRTAYGWHRQGYGYTSGAPCYPAVIDTPPVLATPVLVPTYSIGYSPPPVAPVAASPYQLPQPHVQMQQAAPLAHQPAVYPGQGQPQAAHPCADVIQQMRVLQQEVAALRQLRSQPQGGGGGPGAGTAGLQGSLLTKHCSGCHTQGGEGFKALPMYQGGKLTLTPEQLSRCMESVTVPRPDGSYHMPKGRQIPDAERLGLNRELIQYAQAQGAAQQQPPQQPPAPKPNPKPAAQPAP